MLDGHPPVRIAKSAASQLTTDDERKDRAAGAPEGDFPAEPPTAFPKKPAIAAKSTRSEGEVDRHDSGQPDGSRSGSSQPGGSRRGAGSRSDDPASQADVPRGRGRRNFEGDFELTDRLSKQAQVLREQYRLSARETEVMEYIAAGTPSRAPPRSSSCRRTPSARTASASTRSSTCTKSKSSSICSRLSSCRLAHSAGRTLSRS